MRVVGFDQATNVTGYSVFENKNLIKYGTIDCSQYKDIAERNNNMRNLIISVIERYNGEAFAIEDVHYEKWKGVKTFKALARLLGVLETDFTVRKYAYIILPPSTWRKECGVGKTKEEAVAWVKERFNKDVTDDEADAICIGWCLAQRMEKK